MNTGLDLLDPPGQRVLAFVEPIDVGGLAGELALLLAEFDVAAHRHPVADVIGEERKPLLVAALVQQLGLAIEELGDILHQQELCNPPLFFIGRAVTHRPAPMSVPFRPSPPAPSQPPGTPPRPSLAPAPA